MTHTRAYIALGSNLGDRVQIIESAVHALAATENVTLVAVSSLYESAAMTLPGSGAQPDYINAVAAIDTSLTAPELLTRCLEIEHAQGRKREAGKRWQARTLDMDILLYGDLRVNTDELTIPHPGLADRPFFREPLAEIAPGVKLPSPTKSRTEYLAGMSLFENETTGHTDAHRASSDEAAADTTAMDIPAELPHHLRYVIIEGVIGAGKTSLARRLAEHFSGRLVLEEFDDNPFLERFYDDRPRWALQTQLSFLASRFRQQQTLARPDLFHNVSVSDYAFDKDRIFARINLDGDELSLYETMFSIMQPTVPRPDLIVYLQASTDRLIQNIAERGRPYEANMDWDYIDALNRAYNEYFFHYTAGPLLIVNATHMDFVKQSAHLDEIIRQIAGDTPPGTRYFNPSR
ncbi:MAG: 2-amino-4-hydroxy-6-hydroxymethyldihydropteridine diphosphokinase [Bacteroidetes bacterium CG12_big_fil_rev_8_21_14_0_65_60_17]|nr:MAG: 2-amino-4-hydroxy-6-hydroxymethyldihydropteridine diphosphokinase [Bacteroidetes bacterium CG12_big_fil_rev_8_21_14_0_65_60_17]